MREVRTYPGGRGSWSWLRMTHSQGPGPDVVRGLHSALELQDKRSPATPAVQQPAELRRPCVSGLARWFVWPRHRVQSALRWPWPSQLGTTIIRHHGGHHHHYCPSACPAIWYQIRHFKLMINLTTKINLCICAETSNIECRYIFWVL